MRIALAVERLDPARGGAERGILALAGALTGRGHAVTAVCAGARDADPRFEVLRVGRPSWPRGRRVRGFAAAAGRALQAFDASVVFGDVPGGTVYLPHGGSWAAWRKQEIASSEGPAEAKARAKAIDHSPRQRAARDLERATLAHPRLKGVIALSHLVRDNLKYASEYEGPVAVIPNGIALPPAPLPDPGGRTLLFAAHNFRLKGLAPFLHILSRLKDAKGVVAGRGSSLGYRLLARRLGCHARVGFLGAEASLEGLYAQAGALVQPTFYDPCSLTTLEALARGLPVVSSRMNGASELVGAGGAVVDDPRDAEGFARAIRAVLDGDRSAIRSAARRAAEAVAEPGQTMKAVRQIEAWHADRA